ncbi:hypothetical protein Ami103574_13820 [Aminipila butyrica]|uniref:Uncharacterized protein n=1 Tax=Aminipila butyrica TaxID=433296 RepID=A0A858BXY2_9FIRM|nr:hypothetical protein [Aminipila butyrica]QIB70302.1 hypothetical protein Ami103574_13820 [Aminipila butyrica]
MSKNYIEEVLLVIFIIGFMSYLDERNLNLFDVTKILSFMPVLLIGMLVYIFIDKHRKNKD